MTENSFPPSPAATLGLKSSPPVSFELEEVLKRLEAKLEALHEVPRQVQALQDLPRQLSLLSTGLDKLQRLTGESLNQSKVLGTTLLDSHAQSFAPGATAINANELSVLQRRRRASNCSLSNLPASRRGSTFSTCSLPRPSPSISSTPPITSLTEAVPSRMSPVHEAPGASGAEIANEADFSETPTPPTAVLNRAPPPPPLPPPPSSSAASVEDEGFSEDSECSSPSPRLMDDNQQFPSLMSAHHAMAEDRKTINTLCTSGSAAQKDRHSLISILKPNSYVRLLWDAIIILNTILAGITIPLRLVYFDSDASQSLDDLLMYVDVLWLFDIMLNFNTGYFVGGEVVHDHRSIARTYARGWLCLDLLGLCPLSLTGKGSTAYVVASALKFPRLLQLFPRFSRFRLGCCGKAVLPVFVTVVAMLSTHMIACLWRISIRADGSTQDSQHDITHKYVNDVYWVSTTLTSVGFGDIIPLGLTSRLFASVVMVLGSAIFGVVISGSSIIFSQLLNSETENKITELSRFMHHRAVPRELQTRVRDNLRQHLVYSEASGMAKEVLASLSPAMQSELCSCILSETISSFPLFRNAQWSFVAALAQAHCWEQVLRGDLVTDEGHAVEDLVFVMDGILQAWMSPTCEGQLDSRSSSTDAPLEWQASPTLLGSSKEMTVGAWFGEGSLFDDQRVYTSVIIAMTRCELSVLPAQEYLKILSKYPGLLDAHNIIKRDLLAGKISMKSLRHKVEVDLSSLSIKAKRSFYKGWFSSSKQSVAPEESNFSSLVSP